MKAVTDPTPSTHILVSCCDEGSLLLWLILLLFTVFHHLGFHSCSLPKALGSLITSKPSTPSLALTTPTNSRPGGLLPQRRLRDSPLSVLQCNTSIMWGRCWVGGLSVQKLGTCHRNKWHKTVSQCTPANRHSCMVKQALKLWIAQDTVTYPQMISPGLGTGYYEYSCQDL